MDTVLKVTEIDGGISIAAVREDGKERAFQLTDLQLRIASMTNVQVARGIEFLRGKDA